MTTDLIIDGHVYCFEPVDSPAGHESGQAHLAYVQRWLGMHHQPAWRVRDRAVAHDSHLLRTVDGSQELNDVAFRADREHGRLVWTYDGEDYTKQTFPVNLANLEFTAANIVAEMDYAGVDVALMQTDPTIGRDIDFLAACVRRYPDRLRSMVPVDEWLIPGDVDGSIGRVTEAVEVKGLHAIKFMPWYAYQAGRGRWDEGPFAPWWDAITTLGVPIYFTMGPEPGATDSRASYLDEMARLGTWAERHPDVTVGVTHGFPWRMFLDGTTFELPESIWAPFESSNVHLEVSLPIRIGDIFEFPYAEARPAVALMVDRLGADRLFWGSDMPLQNRFCTYRQSMRFLDRFSADLDESQVAAIMGGTSRRMLRI